MHLLDASAGSQRSLPWSAPRVCWRRGHWTWLSLTQGRGDPFAFRNGIDTVYSREPDAFLCPGGPVNLRRSSIRGIPNTEMWSLIVGRNIAAATQHILSLAHPMGGEIYGRAHCVSRPPDRANQLQFDPVVLVGVHISEERRRPVFGINNYVNPSVIEQVSEGCTSSW